jgi:histidinol phosphatase-like PHP family hydrolase
MTWTPLDCHAHTTMSDGALPPDEMVAAVRARGVRPGIADHISRDVVGALMSEDDVRGYLDALEPLDVLRGGEFCWHDDLWRELPPEVTRRFTHRIGSLHAVILPGDELVRAFDRSWPDALTNDDYMDLVVENIERMAREMPIDIFAHPTLLHLSLWKTPPDEIWTDEREQRVVDALFAAGIAFEVSGRYRAHERLVRRAADAGVRLSLGSDGHSRAHVGDVAWSLALTRELGVRDEDLYDPAVHGSRTRA